MALGLAIIGLCCVETDALALIGIDDYTVLMLHNNGEDGAAYFVDSSFSNYPITSHGDAQIDSDYKIFGTGSGLFDGAGDYLSIPDSDDWDFGLGDFTIDTWVNITDTTGGVIIGNEWGTGGGWDLYVNNVSPYFGFEGHYTGGGLFDVKDMGYIISLNTWYHIAVVRCGNIITVYVNGMAHGTAYCAGKSIDAVCTTGVEVGARTVGIHPYDGWIDELRVSKGVSRWAAEFTPPAEQYAAVVPEPASVFLLGFSILGMSLFRRKPLFPFSHNTSWGRANPP